MVFIISVPSPRLLQTPGVPHVHFTPYSKDESIKIVSLDPPVIFTRPIDDSYDYGEEEATEDRQFLWPRYCAVVWDAIGKSVARDIGSFRALCHKLWRPFVQPIVDGTFGTRDFQKLVVNRRVLFQSEGALTGDLVSNQSQVKKSGVTELPYYAKFLLCAAYLASYNPAKQDQVYFMKSSERKRRKRAGGVLPGRKPKTRRVCIPRTTNCR
jgi:origin recognition complex subunit 5